MIQAHLPTHFIPSSSDLLDMIASAERKLANQQEQAALKKDAVDSARRVRAEVNAVKARFYYRIQHGAA